MTLPKNVLVLLDRKSDEDEGYLRVTIICDFSVKHTLRVLIFFLRFVRGNGTGSTDSKVRSA